MTRKRTCGSLEAVAQPILRWNNKHS